MNEGVVGIDGEVVKRQVAWNLLTTVLPGDLITDGAP